MMPPLETDSCMEAPVSPPHVHQLIWLGKGRTDMIETCLKSLLETGQLCRWAWARRSKPSEVMARNKQKVE